MLKELSKSVGVGKEVGSPNMTKPEHDTRRQSVRRVTLWLKLEDVSRIQKTLLLSVALRMLKVPLGPQRHEGETTTPTADRILRRPQVSQPPVYTSCIIPPL